MHRAAIPFLMIAAALAGCSSGGGVSTASILGSAPTPPAADAAAAAPPASTPTSRAFHVGSVSARAAKCGYNFDVARLKSSYISNEISRGTPPDQMVQIEKFYDVAHNGVMKAASDEANYCSEQKTKTIKTDLSRLLAGDFEPPGRAQVAQKQEEEDDGGFFGGLFSGGAAESDNFGSGDWWSKQQEKAGG
jgi:hypothetical protein